MCFCKRKPPIIAPANRRLISFTINDYPGSINDLNGCNNDGKQLKETLLNCWPDFDVRRFMDSDAKVGTFKTEVAASIAVLNPGEIVLVLPDSCFSGTVTRILDLGFMAETHPTKNRFYQQPGMRIRPPGMKTFVSRGDINWIIISGCGETQYSADAYIDGEYHGAFTYYACKTLRPGITYRQWHNEIRKYLPGNQFEQAPTIEGPDWMLDTMVFSTETLVIHNSTHGTQLTGGSDEDIDEAICFYDGNLRDDDYYNLLSNIVLT
jgi:hypothetical protein